MLINYEKYYNTFNNLFTIFYDTSILILHLNYLNIIQVY